MRSRARSYARRRTCGEGQSYLYRHGGNLEWTFNCGCLGWKRCSGVFARSRSPRKNWLGCQQPPLTQPQRMGAWSRIFPVRSRRSEQRCFWELTFVDRAAKVPEEPKTPDAALVLNGCHDGTLLGGRPKTIRYSTAMRRGEGSAFRRSSRNRCNPEGSVDRRCRPTCQGWSCMKRRRGSRIAGLRPERPPDDIYVLRY